MGNRKYSAKQYKVTTKQICEYLKNGLKSKGLNVHQFAVKINRSDTSVHAVIKGEMRSTYIEGKLAQTIGFKASDLWTPVKKKGPRTNES